MREALQAGVFGTQTVFDLYTISYNYTIYIFTTVAYALCIAAVPVISRHLAEDRNKAFAVAGNLICVSVLVSALVVGLASVVIHFAPVGHWLGVSDTDLPTLRMYLQICVLTLPLIVVIYLLVAVFQSMEHYTLQGSLSLPYNVLLIVFLVLFSSSERVLEYVVVICFAWLLQFAMTIPCIVREKFRLIPGLHFRDPDLKLFARTTVVTVFTTSIFLLCYLADSNTVSSFGSGAVIVDDVRAVHRERRVLRGQALHPRRHHADLQHQRRAVSEIQSDLFAGERAGIQALRRQLGGKHPVCHPAVFGAVFRLRRTGHTRPVRERELQRRIHPDDQQRVCHVRACSGAARAAA